MSTAAFIAAQRAEHAVPHAVSCRALGVSPGWFNKHRGRYGSPRIAADLRDLGWRVSVNTVAAIMAERGLAARRKRRRRGTTRPDKSAGKAPDLLKRDFTPPARPDVTW